MKVTILGSGSPIPTLERAGTSIAVTGCEESVLIDCGPGTVNRLIESGIHPGEIRNLLFTHHHVDHNGEFYHFAIGSWTLGRRDLTVYGPSGTDDLLRSMEEIYAEGFEYRASVDADRSLEGLTDIETERTTEQLEADIGSLKVTAKEVDHSIETFAYRLDDARTGGSVVFSGDTTKVPELAEFAEGADVLIHDCVLGPLDDDLSSRELLWHQTISPDEQYRSNLGEVHADAREAAEVAADADVDTLVLTHLLPYRDTARIRTRAERHFDGTVLVAEDGLQLASPF